MERNFNEETEEPDGLLYTTFEELREVLSTYNDTLRGRCSVCLEQFADSEEERLEGKFTDRADLVRIDNCFHRFHLVCVYRDWFMERHTEVDNFGNKLTYDLPDVKRCPVCRNEVSQADQEHVKQTQE